MGNYISEPNVTFNILPATDLAGLRDQQVLIVGQKLAAGLAPQAVLIEDVSYDDINSLFGAGSHVAGMIREFKALNRISRVDVFPLADPTVSSAAAKAILTLVTNPGGAGTIDITVASAKRYSVSISVTAVDDITDIGDKIVAAFTALGDVVPFTATNVGGTVTFDAKNAGTSANYWDISVSNHLPDTSATLTAWAGGAGTFDSGSTLDLLESAIANVRYQTVVWPRAAEYNITTIQNIMDARFNVDNNILDGVAVQTYPDTLANAEAYASARNSQNMVVIWNQIISSDTHQGSATIEMPDIISAQVAALRSLRLSSGANLANYQSTSSTSDQIGGPEIATLPYMNTRLPNIVPASLPEYPPFEDIQEATTSGLSQIGPNRAANATIMGEMVTTYLEDSAGQADTSYKFLNTRDTVSVIREFFFENLKNKYVQTRLTDGDLQPGRDMANEYSIRAFANELYDECADLLLVQAGSEAKRDFNQTMTVSVDLPTGTATLNIAPLLTSQLRAIIGSITVNFA